MNEHAQQISATTSQHVQRSTQQIPATAELDLPQFGSEDEDETRLTEPTGCKTTKPTKVVAEATRAAEACQKSVDPFHQHSKTQPVAEPDLLRTRDPANSDYIKGCDLPGPQSQDDDEDSSPIVQELDRAEHTQCSSYHYTLTQSGFLTTTLVVGTDSKELVTTGSTKNTSPNQLNDRKVTPTSLQLTNKNARLTIG